MLSFNEIALCVGSGCVGMTLGVLILGTINALNKKD